MKTFRLKIIASYFILLVIFVSCMFPIITKSVQKIVIQSMNEAADELIHTIIEAEDDAGIVQLLKYQQPRLFFRVGIINDKLQLIYDSHTKRLFGSTFFPFQFTSHPEVEEALKGQIGYSEKYSFVLEQKLVYLAKQFKFRGKTYVIRLAFPQEYIQELKRNIEYGFLLFSSVILVLFSAMTVLILYHFTTPIKRIIQAIRPYQEGKATSIPEIHLNISSDDEFAQLAATLNSLSANIKRQFEKITNESNEREALLQGLAEGVIAVDRNMQVVYANENAKRFLRLDDTIVGNTFPTTEHPRCTSFLKRAQETKKVVDETIEILLNSKKIHLNVIASPLEAGGGLLILHDMTIHYKVIEMRKDFIANASHELKTPITIIRGFAETLHDNPHLDKETVIDITEKIVKNCRRMTKTIKNLLTLADIENLPAFKLQSCDIQELVDGCKTGLHAIYPDAKVLIHADPAQNYTIDAEPELLEVAIFNLLDNAAKYSKETPEIEVHLERKAGEMIIAIQDKGIGIPPQDLENIFQRFFTVNKIQSKKLGGSGLGLSIVRTIVEKHLGTIEVSSEAGVGTRFTIRLPDNLTARLDEQNGKISYRQPPGTEYAE